MRGGSETASDYVSCPRRPRRCPATRRARTGRRAVPGGAGAPSCHPYGRGLMNTRDWPIRSKLTALVVAPVAALLALWIFATTLDLRSRPGPARRPHPAVRPGPARRDGGRRAATGTPALGGAARRRADAARPGRTAARTDRAVAELRRRVDGEPLRDAAGDLLEARVDRLVTALAALPAGRDFIDDRKMDRTGAIGLYSGMVDCGLPGVRRAWRPARRRTQPAGPGRSPRWAGPGNCSAGRRAAGRRADRRPVRRRGARPARTGHRQPAVTHRERCRRPARERRVAYQR